MPRVFVTLGTGAVTHQVSQPVCYGANSRRAESAPEEGA